MSFSILKTKINIYMQCMQIFIAQLFVKVKYEKIPKIHQRACKVN